MEAQQIYARIELHRQTMRTAFLAHNADLQQYKKKCQEHARRMRAVTKMSHIAEEHLYRCEMVVQYGQDLPAPQVLSAEDAQQKMRGALSPLDRAIIWRRAARRAASIIGAPPQEPKFPVVPDYQGDMDADRARLARLTASNCS